MANIYINFIFKRMRRKFGIITSFLKNTGLRLGFWPK